MFSGLVLSRFSYTLSGAKIGIPFTIVTSFGRVQTYVSSFVISFHKTFTIRFHVAPHDEQTEFDFSADFSENR